MIKRTRVRASLGVAALAGAATLALLASCSEGGKTAKATPTSAGSGEGAQAFADLKTDNIAYLLQLSLVEGHLNVGRALYAQGALDAAAPHMMHAQGLYPSLAPVLAARGAAPFDGELRDLAEAVVNRASAENVDAAYDKAMAALTAAEGAKTNGALQDPKSVVALIETIVRAAGDTFGAAVKDGRVVEPAEYQDSYGFIQIAKARLQAISAGQPQIVAGLLVQVGAQLDSLSVAWPEGHLIPNETVSATATLFNGAADSIKIAALSL